jgi:hypothetical protein
MEVVNQSWVNCHSFHGMERSKSEEVVQSHVEAHDHHQMMNIHHPLDYYSLQGHKDAAVCHCHDQTYHIVQKCCL